MEPEYEFHSKFNDAYTIVTRRIVRKLSEDSRASISDLSKAVGVSRKTVAEKIKAAESALGITYTLDLNERTLGLVSPHLTLVKFEREPDYDEIAKIFSKTYIPQVVMVTKGAYDLVVYSNSFSNSEYALWDKSMQLKLSDYGIRWRTSEVVHKQLGFFPLRNEVIRRANMEETNKRILEILNDDSRISFSKLSAKLNMHFNTLTYRFRRMLDEKYINRFTLAMEKPKNTTLMSFFGNYTIGRGYEEASANARKAFISDDPDPIASRYLITAPLIGSYAFFTLGVFDDLASAQKYDIAYHKKSHKNSKVKLEYAEVERVLLGRLPIRSVDTKSEYKTIYWNKEVE